MPRTVLLLALTALLSGGCRSAAAPSIRFSPPGTDLTQVERDYPLTPDERRAVTPENLRALTQSQVDQLYARLKAGPIPDGPLQGDLFFPRGSNGRARLRDVAGPLPGVLAHLATLRVERFGRALWKGKVFYRSEGVLRNRIDDLPLLKLIIREDGSIPTLTVDGQTTWLLFPARVACGESRFDRRRESIIIDYSQSEGIEGYRAVPDRVAGAGGLNVRDEIRLVRPGFYLGRVYFGPRFGLNFTLIDPAIAGAPDGGSPGGGQEECNG